MGGSNVVLVDVEGAGAECVSQGRCGNEDAQEQ